MSDQYTDILDSTADRLFKLAEADPNTTVIKSSVEIRNDPLPQLYDDPSVKKSTLIVADSTKNILKGDPDAPFLLTAEDQIVGKYNVYDEASDVRIEDLFYANINTGTLIQFIVKNVIPEGETEEQKMAVSLDGGGLSMRMTTNRKFYFKKNE